MRPERVHVGSCGEEVRHVHLHVTPRLARLPRGNVPASIALDVLALLVRLRLRRPVPDERVAELVDRLRERLRPPTIRP